MEEATIADYCVRITGKEKMKSLEGLFGDDTWALWSLLERLKLKNCFNQK